MQVKERLASLHMVRFTVAARLTAQTRDQMKFLALAFGVFGVIGVAGISTPAVHSRQASSSTTHKPSIAGDALAQAQAGKPVAAPATSGSTAVGTAASDDCLQSDFEINIASAERRIAACSTAIQSKKLDKGQLALARLNRGIARMTLGDMTMAANDYEEALKHYDSAIDSQAPAVTRHNADVSA